MSKIGLFYGTETGKTETAAEAIHEKLGGDGAVDLINISDVEAEELGNYDYLVIGCPTWNIGELQSDWDGIYEDLDDIDFTGKKVAYFGTGDQVGYADNFQDAMGMLEEKISALGGKTIGYWPTEGYDHEESKAVKNGKFVGLALDEDNQSDLTDDRIANWTTQIKTEFGV